ncbi:hypothetical protein D9756_007474 [Leucocoprinus leucothites]|uniref:Glucose receptor Git3 N-terminal domain-containing protein n=1 Tax=Leucocoprinus leucothites TaxID=201217 RepID=A0A8H5D380_9AGAR|nr:hypothetical protein D9756_007474 [Leucoagaricus leucothites]
MLCHIFQAIASIMNARWVSRGHLETGHFCMSQGILKHISDVGTALWTFVIAAHTFCLLFWEMEGLSVFTLWATLVGGWSAIGAIVISGPAVIDLGKMGPYYSVAGLWCWIAPQYKTQQILLGWLLLLMAAALSLVLYPLIFLRLRGNIIRNGWRIKFTKTAVENNERWRGLPTGHSIRIAKQMLLYPVVYTVLILPIVTTRLIQSSGKEAALAGLIFSDAVYQMFGLANVVLFVVTRPILCSDTLLFKGWNISWPFERPDAPQPQSSPSRARRRPSSQLSKDSESQNRNSQSVKSGPSWTQREIKPPPEIVIRDSIGSIYSIYDEHPQFRFEPPLSSHWSPDTPTRSGKQ